jgi:hypothetical protein
MFNLFKKKSRIIFTFEEAETGFYMNVKKEGNIYDDHVFAIKQFIENSIKKAEDGKNKRK